jgi:hypothetical protein
MTLLQSDDPSVQSRVTAATAKLSAGNDGMRNVLMKDNGQTAVRKILSLFNTKKSKYTQSVDFQVVRQWLVESLSYLCLHGAVKELVIKDENALDLLFSLGNEDDKMLRYFIIIFFF